MPKFFTHKSLITENTLTITGEEADHITKTLRKKEGDIITVGDGEMTDYVCEIKKADKTSVFCGIREKMPNENEPSLKITLFQALPKGDKFETVIQKCVEIGVTEFIPIDTKNSMVKIKSKEDKKIARWNKIAFSAAKQCGRGIIPAVKPLMAFSDAVSFAKDNFDKAVIPYEAERETSIKDFARGFTGKTLAVFIGSEGGFDPEEIALARERGIISLTMGRRILRTETAGLTASVIMLYEGGDLS